MNLGGFLMMLVVLTGSPFRLDVEPGQRVELRSIATDSGGFRGVMCTGEAGICAGAVAGTILIDRRIATRNPDLAVWVLAHEQEHYRRWAARERGTDLGDPADEAAADTAACAVMPMPWCERSGGTAR